MRYFLGRHVYTCMHMCGHTYIFYCIFIYFSFFPACLYYVICGYIVLSVRMYFLCQCQR